MSQSCDHTVLSGSTLERRVAVRFCASCNVMVCDQCGEQFFSNARKFRPANEWPVGYSTSFPAKWVAVHEPVPEAIPCGH